MASLQFTQIELQEAAVGNSRQLATDTGTKVAKITNELQRLDQITNYLDNQSRRNNLRVDGVKEMQGEKWADTEVVLREAISRQLQLPVNQVKDIPMERAHRTGDASGQRDRTIVVKFTLFKDRYTMLPSSREESSSMRTSLSV